MDFIQIVDSIFKNKKNYSSVSDEEKNKNFYIINQKFSAGYVKQAQFFNSKFMDKASALDFWNLFFRSKQGIPSWYWQAKAKKSEEKTKKISTADRKLFLQYNEKLKESDVDFLIQYYLPELIQEIKNLKKFDLDPD
jgi:hypothetical protein